MLRLPALLPRQTPHVLSLSTLNTNQTLYCAMHYYSSQIQVDLKTDCRIIRVALAVQSQRAILAYSLTYKL
jgi:hypothetical protein